MAYLPHTPEDVAIMLEAIGKSRLEELFSAIPEEDRLLRPLRIPECRSESEILAEFSRLAEKNLRTDDRPSFLGAGAYRRFIPAAVDYLASRGEFNTAYTPYQPEVSQGTLQATFEYQSLIARLTGMEISNASMYEGATAIVEAVFMANALKPGAVKEEEHGQRHVLVSDGLHPDHRATLETYLAHQDLDITTVPLRAGGTDTEFVRNFIAKHTAAAVVAVVFQSPNFFGYLEDGFELRAATESPVAGGDEPPEEKTASRPTGISGAATGERPFLIASVDPISLALVAPPGAYDADIAVGDGQQLGGALNYGGPSFGFFATHQRHVRKIPGRVVGETTDRDGTRGYVLTFQTREQHIRRERATSNICTNQGLCSLRAAMYLTLLGEQGLRTVAEASVRKAHHAWTRLGAVPGIKVTDAPFFQEFPIHLPLDAELVYDRLQTAGIGGGLPLGRYFPERRQEMLLACTELTSLAEIEHLTAAVAGICARQQNHRETRTSPSETNLMAKN